MKEPIQLTTHHRLPYGTAPATLRPFYPIFSDLLDRLNEENLIDEYFTFSPPFRPDQTDQETRERLWPTNVKWITCYAVTGANEGHYIHVDLIYTAQALTSEKDYEMRTTFAFGKTFKGWDHAWLIAKRCAEHLGA